MESMELLFREFKKMTVYFVDAIFEEYEYYKPYQKQTKIQKKRL